MRTLPNPKSIWRTILEAEALRQDKRYFDAYEQFKQVLDNSGHVNLLSPEQQRWLHAHGGAAAGAAFTPNEDTDYLLTTATTWLEKALKDNKGTPYKRPYPWASAQLGEVYRNKGNLPVLWFHDDNPAEARGGLELKIRNCSTDYTEAEKLFNDAGGKDGSGWVQAHLGALLINKRRYYKEHDDKKGSGKEDDERTAIPQKALGLLQSAARTQKGKSPWTNQYISAAHFTLAIAQLKLEGLKAATLTGFLLSLEFTVLGWHTAPNLLRNPIQPGAFEMDATFTILYDLFDLLSTTTPETGLDFAELVLAMGILARALAAVPAMERYLPGASALRFEYINLYLLYLELLFLLPQTGEKQDNKKYTDQIETIQTGLKLYADELLVKAREIRSADPVLKDSIEKKNKLSPSLKNGFLLSVLSVLTSLLKAGALIDICIKKINDEKEEKKNIHFKDYTQDLVVVLRKISAELKTYNSAMPVLRKSNGMKSIKLMVDLHDKKDKKGFPVAYGNRWLLSPLWTIGSPAQEEVLKQLLKLKDQSGKKKQARRAPRAGRPKSKLRTARRSSSA